MCLSSGIGPGGVRRQRARMEREYHDQPRYESRRELDAAAGISGVFDLNQVVSMAVGLC
jgi:hypothetical protein